LTSLFAIFSVFAWCCFVLEVELVGFFVVMWSGGSVRIAECTFFRLIFFLESHRRVLAERVFVSRLIHCLVFEARLGNYLDGQVFLQGDSWLLRAATYVYDQLLNRQ